MNNNNETKPYPIRLKDSTINTLKQMVEESGEGTIGDFVDVLLATYSVSKVVKSSSDIEELNQLTTRMYKLYLNLVDKNEVGISNIQSDCKNQLDEMNCKIVDLKNQLTEQINKTKSLQEPLESTRKQNDEYKREIDKLANHIAKSDKLITKLEEDLLELTELKNENMMLRVKNQGYEDEISNTINKEKELEDIIKHLKIDKEKLLESIEQLKLVNEDKIREMQSKSEFMQQKQELTFKEELQQKLAEKEAEINNIRNNLFQEKQSQHSEYVKIVEENRKLNEMMQELKVELNKK